MELSASPAWYCVRSQLKHEHIAAGHLRKGGIETFLPRIAFKRATRQGPQWTTEALFPSYLFARFSLKESLRFVQSAHGVSTVVHFGLLWPCIPDADIAELRSMIRDDSIHVIAPELEPGHEVQIAEGMFQGLHAVVTRVMPGRQRVKVLLEFLGRQTEAEVATAQVVRTADPRGLVEAPGPAEDGCA